MKRLWLLSMACFCLLISVAIQLSACDEDYTQSSSNTTDISTSDLLLTPENTTVLTQSVQTVNTTIPSTIEISTTVPIITTAPVTTQVIPEVTVQTTSLIVTTSPVVTTSPILPEPTPEVCVHEYTVNIKEASCTQKGEKNYICSKCDYSYSEVIEKLKHTYANATCTTPKTCTVCGAKKGSALGHSHVLTQVNEATCTQAGSKIYTCHCGDKYSEVIAQADHIYSDATCTAPKTCKTCGITVGDILDHNYQLTSINEATCRTEGRKTYTCVGCADSYTDIIAKLQHNYTEATCIAPKTCTECGWAEGGLAKCSYVLTQTVEGSCAVRGYDVYTCEICKGSYTQKHDRIDCAAFEWVVSTPPTKYEDGWENYCCVDCGVVYNSRKLFATGSEGLVYRNWSSTTCIVVGMGTCTDTELLIPARHNGRQVIGIDARAFYENTDLVSVRIPWGFETIGEYAFYMCTNLKTVKVVGGIESIGQVAFGYCENLQSITVEYGVQNIGYQAFYGCESLQSVTIGQFNGRVYPTVIERYAFWKCSALKNVTIENPMESIGECAFLECGNLQNITLTEGLTNIGDRAFENCKNLQSITFPSSLLQIGESAFRYCQSLTVVAIPEGITELKDCTFYDCTGLKELTLPKSLDDFNSTVFYNCADLYMIYFNGTCREWYLITWDRPVIKSYPTVLCSDGYYHEYGRPWSRST